MTNGICFEAAWDAAGTAFIIQNDAQLQAFYEGVDHSQLCRHPIVRQPFDFSNGQVLVGLWSKGQGCKAHYDVLSVDKDDTAKTIVISLQFITEGTCNYELVRGFWVGLEAAAGYNVNIRIL